MKEPSPRGLNEMKGARTISLEGIIIPSAWDEEGNVSRISLSSYDEEEYALEGDNRWNELLALLRERVRVRGLVFRDNETQTIRIKGLKKIEGSVP